MPLNTEMPAWLGARADAGWKNAASVVNSFDPFADYIAGKQAALKIEGMKLNLGSAALGIQQQQANVDLRQMQMKDQEQGMQEFPAWLRKLAATGKRFWIRLLPAQAIMERNRLKRFNRRLGKKVSSNRPLN